MTYPGANKVKVTDTQSAKLHSVATAVFEAAKKGELTPEQIVKATDLLKTMKQMRVITRQDETVKNVFSKFKNFFVSDAKINAHDSVIQTSAAIRGLTQITQKLERSGIADGVPSIPAATLIV